MYEDAEDFVFFESISDYTLTLSKSVSSLIN